MRRMPSAQSCADAVAAICFRKNNSWWWWGVKKINVQYEATVVIPVICKLTSVILNNWTHDFQPLRKNHDFCLEVAAILQKVGEVFTHQLY